MKGDMSAIIYVLLQWGEQGYIFWGNNGMKTVLIPTGVKVLLNLVVV